MSAGILRSFLRTTSPNGFLVCTEQDRKSTRLNSSHSSISYAVFCLKKKIKYRPQRIQLHNLVLHTIQHVAEPDVPHMCALATLPSATLSGPRCYRPRLPLRLRRVQT